MEARDAPTFERDRALSRGHGRAGRLNTDRSIAEYRRTVRKHAEDAGARPDATTRDEVKATLRRWSHPNTKRRKRTMLVSFYDWMVEEGLRAENPCPPDPRTERKAPRVRRLTLDEVLGLAVRGDRRTERRMAFLACAGLRCSELRLLQGLHFTRAGWVLVSAEMAKGGRERWIPVMADLEPIVEEIRQTVDSEHFVLPATRWVESDRGLVPVENGARPCDRKTIWRTVKRIGRRAAIGTDVHPPAAACVRRPRDPDGGPARRPALLGHASIQTTEGYHEAVSG